MENFEEFITDRKKFNDYIYTPLSVAISEYANRQDVVELDTYLSTLPAGIPPQLENGLFGVVFRPIATPDYDMRRFLSIAEMIPNLTPVIMEYHSDRFLNRNECKFALGKLCFITGKNKQGDMLFEHKSIIDINDSNKKKLHEISTHWGQNLIEFHREFMEHEYTNKTHQKPIVFDASEWVAKSGKTPEKYYEAFLSLFLKNGILFENFMLNDDELTFTRDVILPAFTAVYKKTGYKPLIVALQPTEIEGNKFWLAHPKESMNFLTKKIST